MILVDSSILIPALGRAASPAALRLRGALDQGLPIAICPYVYQEVLQGVADDATYRRVKTYLDTQECLWLPATLETFDLAARLYQDLRRAGVTVRGSIDVLIALTALHHEAYLMHDDRDFDHIAAQVTQLRVWPRLV